MGYSTTLTFSASHEMTDGSSAVPEKGTASPPDDDKVRDAGILAGFRIRLISFERTFEIMLRASLTFCSPLAGRAVLSALMPTRNRKI